MADIGGWWVKGFAALPEETVTASYYANHLRRDARPLGGKVYVTSERVLFCPHLIDAVFGGERSEILIADIADAAIVTPSETDGYGGGTERRIRIEQLDGGDVIFILNELDDGLATIEEAIVSELQEQTDRMD